MPETDHQHILAIAQDIAGLEPRLRSVQEAADALSSRFTDKRLRGAAYASQFLLPAIISQGLRKSLLLLQNNLTYLETLGVLALTRYIFELRVWFRLLKHDPSCAIEFMLQVYEDQEKHIRRYITKLQREAELFTQLHPLDGVPEEIANQSWNELEGMSAEAMNAILQKRGAEVDVIARREFSLYAREAQHFGYGYAAQFIGSTVVPRAQSQLDALLEDRGRFEAAVGSDLLEEVTLTEKRRRKTWNWRDRAQDAGIVESYDFIYGYTSRLLHATPTSFFTNHKNLEPREMEAFLDHTYVSLLEIIEVGHELMESDRVNCDLPASDLQ